MNGMASFEELELTNTIIRKHRPSPAAPVVLCGCQADLRADPVTASHLAKTGRAPVSAEQGGVGSSVVCFCQKIGFFL